MNSEHLKTKEAFASFKAGDYKKALKIYELLSSTIGKEFFKANIDICNNRLRGFFLENSFYQEERVNGVFTSYLLLNDSCLESDLCELKDELNSIHIEKWIDDEEDFIIEIKFNNENIRYENKPLGIVKFEFFDSNGLLFKPLSTKLSWSEGMSSLYSYIRKSEGNCSFIKFIKPSNAKFVKIGFLPWGENKLLINNKIKIIRAPSIRNTLDSNFKKILQEIEKTVAPSFSNPHKSNKICYVLNQCLPFQSEGYATRSHALARSIKESGLDIVCISKPGYPASFIKEYKEKEIAQIEIIEGIEYHRLTEPKGWKGTHNYIEKASIELEKKFVKENPSCVIAASDYRNALPALLAARRLGITFIYEVRGFWEVTLQSRQPQVVETSNYHLTRFFEELVANNSDHVFTLTDAMRQDLISRGISNNKLSLLPNSCDPIKFDPNKNPRNVKLQAHLKIPPDVPVIGYVGTFNEYEGLDDLMHACGGLFERGLKFRVLLVGAEPSKSSGKGFGAEQLIKIAETYGFESWLILPGKIPHDLVANYYSIIDITPFTRKPLPVTELVSPIKPLEAMAMGKALIVSSVGALAELIKDGTTGIVYKKGDISDLTEGIYKLVKDKSLRDRLGSSAREWAINNRTWRNCSNKINEVLELINNKKNKISCDFSDKLPAKFASKYNVAFISDEFTFNSFKNEFVPIVIEPSNWKSKFLENKPDIFFCESAWSGVDSKKRPWQGKIYKSINWKHENRSVIFAILDYCKKEGIPTIFWNKEDPTHFTDRVHDFIDTAKHFDFVFTTAEECCQKYKDEYGVKNVFALPFATNPRLFNPIEKNKRSNKVVFAGSWYGNHELRSVAMESILDLLIRSGFNIEIYDRYYGSEDKLHKWPERYLQYIKPGVPHSEMPDVYRSSKIGLNFNTVVESPTMFARRVFELMSSNTLVLSNYSVGVDNFFDELVIFVDKNPERLKNLSDSNIDFIREKALSFVLKEHTYKKRWEYILSKIGAPWIPDIDSLTCVYKVKSDEDVLKAIDFHQGNLHRKNVNLLLLVDNDVPPLKVSEMYTRYNRAGITLTSLHFISNYAIKEKFNPIETKYFLYITDLENVPNIDWVDKAILHSQYLEDENLITVTKNKSYTFDSIKKNQPIFGRSSHFVHTIFNMNNIVAYSV